MENNTNQFWKHSLTMGAIMGGVSIVESVLMYVFGYFPVSFVGFILFFLINLLITIFVLRYAIISYRKTYLGGFITIGQAFMVGLVTVFIGALIAQLYSYVFTTLIDTQYVGHIQQVTKDAMEQMFKKQGLSEDMIQTQLSKMDERFASQTPFKTLWTGILSATIVGAIISFIMAAILKKDKDSIA